jgi:hypothetical protein
MVRMTRAFAGSLSAILLAGAMAPVSAMAAPAGGMIASPISFHKDSTVKVVIINKEKTSQDVKADGHVYTIAPEQSVTIVAAAGTPVYADSEGPGHQKGDLLFKVGPEMKNAKILLK